MSQKINLFNDVWVDLLFKERNQKYGAFQLRKDSAKRHKWGIIISLILFALIIGIPILYKQIASKNKERMVEVTTLSDIQIDQKKVEKPKDIIIDVPPPPLKSTIKFTPPVIKPDEEVQEEEVIKTQEELTQTEVKISSVDVKGTDEVNGVDVAELNNQIVEDTISAPYAVVEQMPEFPGGELALRKYLAKMVKYPAIAQENGIQGKVFISFVVEGNGTISNVKVGRGVDSSLDQEAIRVVKSMPKWIPGKQNGRTVRVSYTVPISFILQ